MKHIKEFNEFINESKIVLKRKYRDYPSITVNKSSKIRNYILEEIGKNGKISKQKLDELLQQVSLNSSKWLKNNLKYFVLSEDEVTLSSFGQKILNSIMINESKDTGLYLIGKTKRDNDKIGKILDKLGLYGEFDEIENYWFLPEDEENYDELEMAIQPQLDKMNVNAHFESI